MKSKVLAAILASVAVILAAIAGIVVTSKRADAARLAQLRAENEEARAAQEAKKAKAEQLAAEAQAAAKKSAAEEAQETRQAEQARQATAKIERERAIAEARKAESEAKTASDQAKAAEAVRAAEKAKVEAARIESEKVRTVADAAQARAEAEAQAAASKLAAEKLKSDAVIAEAKVLELRQVDFETLERELLEFKLELDERERALHPDKTASDLVWVGEREADVIGGASNAVKRAKKVRVLPENDRTLPPESRQLARIERVFSENRKADFAASSNRIVRTLERLYVEAVREDRVVDADYYLENIRLFYPGWKYQPAMANQTKETK